MIENSLDELELLIEVARSAQSRTQPFGDVSGEPVWGFHGVERSLFGCSLRHRVERLPRRMVDEPLVRPRNELTLTHRYPHPTDHDWTRTLA